MSEDQHITAQTPPRSVADQLPAPQRRFSLDGTIKLALETGRTRLLVTALVFAAAFLVVGARLVEISLFQDALEPRLAQRTIGGGLETGRADIVDRNGVILATTMPAASLYANPRQIDDPQAVARRLARILPEIAPEALAARLGLDRSFVWLKRKISPRQQYEVNRLGIPGLYFQRERERVYPHGALTSHVVGYTNVDNQGLAGMEQAYDELLRSGIAPLQLSLDLSIQHILSEELAAAMAEFRAIGATGLVLDADSGEVVAMSSLPSFAPENVGSASADARFNRASLGIYEMGSVFKIFTTAMALEEGVVGLEDGYDVSKPIRVARFTINDYKPKKRWLSIPEIFIYSSNIGTVHMAMEAGTSAQQSFLAGLGLTGTPRYELPEIGQPLKPSPWREINTMTISYGHGLAVSPIQLASAVAAVVNGGQLKPVTLLKRTEGQPVEGHRVMSPETSRKMSWLMRLVVRHGTGRKADATGYMVGGKTGTADKLRGRGYARNARIASFVAAFPMDRPRYVIFAMVDEPKGTKETHGYATGGWVAAPVVRRVVERIAPLLGVRPRPPDEEEGAEALLIPVNFKGTMFAAQ
ncbi:MAG: penicillin-binding protein 2 [Pseudomonadota bacterium]